MLAFAIDVERPLEAHVAIAPRITECAGGEGHGSQILFRRELHVGLVENPHRVALFVVGEADAGSGHAAALEGHRARHAHDLLDVHIGGLLALGDEAVACFEPDVATDVERAVLGADEGFLAGDDVVAALAVFDGDLHAVELVVAGLAGRLAIELHAEVALVAFELNGVSAAGDDLRVRRDVVDLGRRRGGFTRT